MTEEEFKALVDCYAEVCNVYSCEPEWFYEPEVWLRQKQWLERVWQVIEARQKDFPDYKCINEHEGLFIAEGSRVAQALVKLGIYDRIPPDPAIAGKHKVE